MAQFYFVQRLHRFFTSHQTIADTVILFLWNIGVRCIDKERYIAQPVPYKSIAAAGFCCCGIAGDQYRFFIQWSGPATGLLYIPQPFFHADAAMAGDQPTAHAFTGSFCGGVRPGPVYVKPGEWPY